MIFYIVTVVNLVLCLIAMIALLLTAFRYNTARRWQIYSIYNFTILIGVALVNVTELFKPPGEWQLSIISTVIVVSKLWFAYCLRFSSIRKI